MSQPSSNAFLRTLSKPAYAAVAGAVVLLVVVFFWQWPTPMLMGYLAGWLFCLGIPLGTTGVGLVHRMSGGDWGKQLLDDVPTRVRPLPLMAILFIPILVGAKHLYPWIANGIVEPLEEARFRHWYLTPTFLIARSVIYFVIWIVISKVGVSAKPNSRPVGTAGFGFLVLIVTITLAMTDWIGLLSADFYSTIFGLYLAISFALTALCVMIISTMIRHPSAPAKRMIDWGNLLLTFVILHAYFAFSQFLIVWSSNLPREIRWYDERIYGLWGGTALTLIVIQLFLPLFVLLFRNVKRNKATLAATASLAIAAQWIEAAWLVLPSMKEKDAGSGEYLLALAVMAIVTAGIGLFMWPRMLWSGTATPLPAAAEGSHA